jgi:hypothetical protein
MLDGSKEAPELRQQALAEQAIPVIPGSRLQ